MRDLAQRAIQDCLHISVMTEEPGRITRRFLTPAVLEVHAYLRRRMVTLDMETAVDEFLKLLDHNPNYSAAYFHGAQTLEKMGRIDEAKGLYRRGIEVTSAIGDDHTCSELQAALDLLG